MFLAVSYSSKVDYGTGQVYPHYKTEIERMISLIESAGHEVFCALRADGYEVNDDDPAMAFSLDVSEIEKSDAVLAIINDKVSAGVQVEIGYAVAKGKKVILAHDPECKSPHFNAAMIKSGVCEELLLPLTPEKLNKSLLQKNNLGYIMKDDNDATIREFQDWVMQSWLDYKGSLPNRQMQLLFVVEELGEVAEALRKKDGSQNKKHKDIQSDLESEMGDLFLSLCTLASANNVDLSQAAQIAKQKIIARHGG